MGLVGQLGCRAALVALLLLACGTATARDAVAPAAAPLAGYGAEALAVRAYTAERLAYYGGAPDCATAPFVAYARSNLDGSVADAWYVALQISADATLVRLGAAEYRCEMDKALVYLERLWASDGGYAPRMSLAVESMEHAPVDGPDPEAVTSRRRYLNERFGWDTGPDQYELDLYARLGRTPPTD